MTTPPSSAGPTAQELLLHLERDDVVNRFWGRDVTLWTNDPKHHRIVENRLGWLDSPAHMQARVPDILASAEDIRAAGFDRAVLVGMGGSSLCPEVLANTFDTKEGLDLRIADSTSPHFVRELTAWATAGSPLYIIASKSGSTIEVKSLLAHFQACAPSGDSFIAITDPDTALASLAAESSFRSTFTNPPDIGGRFSALSCFGLVPAALMGIDIRALLLSAQDMADRCRRPVNENPGALLGAQIAAALCRGRDKMYLQLQPPLAAFAPWVEQLIAESTGKAGTGVLPVPLEDPADMADGVDRWILLSGDDTRGDNGTPTFRIAMPTSPFELGAEFFRWEFATGIAAHLLGINPFDEPNVTEAKTITGRILDPAGGAAPLGDAPITWPNESTLESVDALLGSAETTDYVALLAFLPPWPDTADSLSMAARSIALRTGATTTVGIGPRYLHSTGQYHKGGPATGVFLVLTCAETESIPIPGQSYDFSQLFDAQAMGDVGALLSHDRRVLHVRLDALDDLASFVEALRVRRARHDNQVPPSTDPGNGV